MSTSRLNHKWNFVILYSMSYKLEGENGLCEITLGQQSYWWDSRSLLSNSYYFELHCNYIFEKKTL